MSCITVYNKLQELAQYHSESWADGVVITIGRDEATNFPLPDIPSLSRHHLSIRKLGGDFYIRDEQSSNGTTANGVRMTHALRMHAQLAYQAGPLTIYLENAPASTPNPEENADSAFPEPYGFALQAVEPAPIAYAEPAPEVYAEPAPEVYAEPAPAVYAEPAPAAVVEDDCIDLAQMAALKKARAQQAQQQAAPVEYPAPVEYAAPVEYPAPVEYAAPVAEPEPTPEPAPAPAPAAEIQPIRAHKKIINTPNGAARPFLPISGIPKTGIPQDFQLEIATLDGSNQIVEGETLQLRVRASEKCKIILICQEEDGTKTMLYPNKYQTSMDIPANTWVTVPEEGAFNYELSIEGVGCMDTIQAIARKSSICGVKRQAAPRKKGATTPPSPEAKPKKTPAQWAHAHIELEVIDAQ